MYERNDAFASNMLLSMDPYLGIMPFLDFMRKITPDIVYSSVRSMQMTLDTAFDDR